MKTRVIGLTITAKVQRQSEKGDYERRLHKRLNGIAMPDAIKRLPLSEDGYPIPWFAQWFLDGKPGAVGVGKPDFRFPDRQKRYQSNDTQCWICGERLGEEKAFVAGSSIVRTRMVHEPPSHRERAIFAAKASPFICNPKMRRNRTNLPAEDLIINEDVSHPDTYCVWVTRRFTASRCSGGRKLWRLGDPDVVLWFSGGKEAKPNEGRGT